MLSEGARGIFAHRVLGKCAEIENTTKAWLRWFAAIWIPCGSHVDLGRIRGGAAPVVKLDFAGFEVDLFCKKWTGALDLSSETGFGNWIWSVFDVDLVDSCFGVVFTWKQIQCTKSPFVGATPKLHQTKSKTSPNQNPAFFVGSAECHTPAP